MRVLGLVLAVVAACSKSSQPSPPPAPAGSSQLVTAIVPDWSSTAAELRLWRRDGKAWKLVLGPWPGVVGAKGTAWGIGAHGSGAPAGRGGPIKREGDGKSPAGIFDVRASYGYAATATTALPYHQVDEHWKCVDDSKSRVYTQIVDERALAKDWSSAEDMRRTDELYEWVVDLAHNARAQPGGGSCIFLHVWSGPQSSTAGCTAMAEDKLVAVLERLAPGARFVLLPKTEYDALAAGWDLPQ